MLLCPVWAAIVRSSTPAAAAQDMELDQLAVPGCLHRVGVPDDLFRAEGDAVRVRRVGQLHGDLRRL